MLRLFLSVFNFERTGVETKIDKLRDLAREFNEKAVGLGLNAEKTEQAVTDIKKTTKDLKDAVTTLKNINKIPGIIAAAVTLAGAIMSGNPVEIGKAIVGAATAASA